MAGAAHLHIQLIGTFQLGSDEEPLPTPPGRSQALLAYLVLRPGIPQRRAQIAVEFWPEASEERSRENLRKPLHLLRRALPEADHFLSLDNNAITWRADAPYTLDVDDFARACQSARTPEELSQAVALYTGDLLPGCYDEWIATHRERLYLAFTRLLRKAIAEREAAGDFGAALAYAERWRLHDPDDPIAGRCVGRLHHLSIQHAIVGAESETVPPPAAPGATTAEGSEAPLALPAPVVEALPASDGRPATDDVPAIGQEAKVTARPRFRHPRLLLAIVLPLLGLIVFAFVRWWQEPSATLPSGAYQVTIQANVAAASAGSFVPVTGSADGLPWRTRIWTVVRANGSYWPQQEAFRTGNRWVGVARIGGGPADRGRDLDVLAVLVDRAADSRFGAWLHFGYETGAYPPLARLPSGARTVAVTTVHVK